MLLRTVMATRFKFQKETPKCGWEYAKKIHSGCALPDLIVIDPEELEIVNIERKRQSNMRAG